MEARKTERVLNRLAQGRTAKWRYPDREQSDVVDGTCCWGSENRRVYEGQNEFQGGIESLNMEAVVIFVGVLSSAYQIYIDS